MRHFERLNSARYAAWYAWRKAAGFFWRYDPSRYDLRLHLLRFSDRT
jgi:hypothetical protein